MTDELRQTACRILECSGGIPGWLSDCLPAELPEVRLQGDRGPAPREVVCAVLAAYGKQYERNHYHTYRFDGRADALAEQLEPDSFSAMLEWLWRAVNIRLFPQLIVPIFRFASGTALQQMIADWRTREWSSIYAAGEALLLNDSREAIILAADRGVLTRYAALRGVGEPFLLDSVLPGGENDALREQVAASRRRQLFRDFLSGGVHRSGRDWGKAYLGHPVLRQAAENVVWAQNGRSFLLKGTETVDAYGRPFTVADDAPVRLAHPMDLAPEETEAWRMYFHNNCLHQPFVQVEEVAHDESEICRDRYQGITVAFRDLADRDAEGIRLQAYHNNIEIKTEHCDLAYETVLPAGYDYTDMIGTTYARLEDFRFDVYDHQVNHVVNLLDRAAAVTLAQRDDLRLETFLPAVPERELARLIDLAAEWGSSNAMALLLEEKNHRWKQDDPLDAFAL
ncbi:MAG: DUF4132 domain-containing protein [Oscillospiraceae bacterium]|nr:DUF4132 domain-containing protein [Oscillospiraceae bacterium]